MATRYQLRRKDKKNYRDLCQVQLPRAKCIKDIDATLYELEIVEDVYNSRVKVHFVGYDSGCDEWRDKADIVSLKPQYDNDWRSVYCVYAGPLYLHSELAYQVKLALKPSTRSDPNVRINKYLFVCGLQQAGKFLKSSHGYDIYGITSYSSLVPILGRQWHLRVLNKEKDFCHAILDTVQFIYTGDSQLKMHWIQTVV